MARCVSPFFHKDLKIALPCSKCVACKINKRRFWTARNLMEWESYKGRTIFFTLTYSDEHLPENRSVDKRELQLFFKRLRKNTGMELRYYACGEYGDLNFRPHYHGILYGMPYSLNAWEHIARAWQYRGFIDVKDCNANRIEYTAGYVSKKLSSVNKIKDLGLTPEFHIMSRRPALGSVFLEELKKFAFTQNPFDVIRTFKFGNKYFPLDRLMREKLRNALMSEDYIRDLKNMQIECMQEDLLDVVEEVLGFDARLSVDNLIRLKDDLHWTELNEFYDLVGTAYFNSSQHKEDLMLVRRNQRRLVRKDL